MTFKEKLQIEHPDCVGGEYAGECKDCPYKYGYESEPEAGKPGHPCFEGVGIAQCVICWNREIPGTEPTEAEPCEWCEAARDLRMYDAEIDSSLPYKFCPMCGKKLDYQEENTNAINVEGNKAEESK